MTDIKTPVTETDNDIDENKQSDARIILGPLVKYAAAGFVIVGIIITTAVMLDSQFNDIDREVAALEAQLAQANMEAEVATDTPAVQNTADVEADTVEAVVTEVTAQQPAISESAEITEAGLSSANTVAETVEASSPQPQTATQSAAVETKITDTNAADNSIVENAVTVNAASDNPVAQQAGKKVDIFDQSIEDLIAERNEYLKEMDRVYLEQFRASQEKQLQLMRERLARQEKRIAEMEKRNQEIYDIRASSVKEMQRMRETFLTDRI